MSGSIELTKEYFDAHNPTQEGSGSSQVDLTFPLSKDGVPIPNSFAVRIGMPSAFAPGVDLVVSVRALGDYHVLWVGQVQ
jgi:hypothetical protein